MSQTRLDDSQIICPCSGTRISHIRRYVDRGIVDVAAISEGTGALSGCGGCEFDLLELLVILQAESGDQAAEVDSKNESTPAESGESELRDSSSSPDVF